MVARKISIFFLFTLSLSFLSCQSSDVTEPEDQATRSTTSSAAGGASASSGFQPTLSGNSSPTTGLAETYTLTISGSPIFPIRIQWASFPTGFIFNSNPQDVIQPTNQVTVGATAPQAGTYDLIATVMDSSQPSRQETIQMQINVIAAGGATGIIPGPTTTIIAGPPALTASGTTSITYTTAAPSHFVGPLAITWACDDTFINDQLKNQLNTLSVNIIAAPKTLILAYKFTLFVTIVDANLQVVTGQMTVKVCTFSPC